MFLDVPRRGLGELREEQIEEAALALDQLRVGLQIVESRIAEATGCSVITVSDLRVAKYVPRIRGIGAPSPIWEDGCSIWLEDANDSAAALVAFAAVRLYTDGQIQLGAGYLVNRQIRELGHWTDNDAVPINSAEQQEIIQRLVTGLLDNLPGALSLLDACRV